MANRIPEVSPVLDEAGLPLHGFCRFEEIRPYLLSCRAASRIPDAACTVLIALFPYRFPPVSPIIIGWPAMSCAARPASWPGVIPPLFLNPLSTIRPSPRYGRPLSPGSAASVTMDF